MHNSNLGDCPAKKLAYATLADTLRNVLGDNLPEKFRANVSRELDWVFSDNYGKSVERNNGVSFDYCCTVLDFDKDTLRKVIKVLYTHKKIYKDYIDIIINNIYNYNNIYYNLFRDYNN